MIMARETSSHSLIMISLIAKSFFLFLSCIFGTLGLFVKTFLFLEIIVFLVRDLLFFMRRQRVEYFADVRFLLNLLFFVILFVMVLLVANLIAKFILDVKAKVTVRHQFETERVLSWFLLPVGCLEGLGEFIEMEELMVDDANRVSIA